MSETGAGAGPAQDPRPVSRGLKLQLLFLGIDSLYLVIEYPHADLFEQWSAAVKDLADPRLHEGIAYEGLVLRRGGLGYKLSVWDGDARLFLTDRVNDTLADTPSAGHGMGAMLQLGPKWLRRFGDVVTDKALKANVLGQLLLFGMQHPEQYPIRLNRMDLTADVRGLKVGDLPVHTWREQWVGYARPRSAHFAPRTGAVEGLAVGSSEGSVRFKVYDKVAESWKDGDYGFWCSVWGVPEGGHGDVARFEWSVRCYDARFARLRYLSDLTFERFVALLNYVSLKWGRLCIPQPGDQTPTRWPLAPLWAELRRLIEGWSLQYAEVARRDYDFEPDVKEEYLRFVTGTLAGLQVRVGYERGQGGPASLAQALSFLHREGHTVGEMELKARKKWQVFARLAGRG